MPDGCSTLVRRSIDVLGVVQGVGFRPFVHLLASRHALAGFVRNGAGQVCIEVEGEERAVEAFLGALRSEAPPLARIDQVTCAPRPILGDGPFRIESSDERRGDGTVTVAADAATCADCLRELFDPRDRRYRYPFVNCTACGPRLTIITGAPYDRARTTMASFPMCGACRAEYEDPRDRRFHAQPIACPRCGPRLRAVDAHGTELGPDAIAVAAGALRSGKILAIKGLGGYHLACRAGDQATVAELRRRKGRDQQPFAVMVADVVGATRLCEVSADERVVLESAARPIVLLGRRLHAPVAEAVAPELSRLGVMLPYTPIHHCLLREMDGEPLVMTSGNRHAEPMAYDDADALERLAGIADAFVVHDRPIHARCDDSVSLVIGGHEPAATTVRRSRGLAPLPVTLPFDVATPTLAVGGHLKATFALGFGRKAFLSHHLGDLDDLHALCAYRDAIAHYEGLFRMTPRRMAHDLHPDYASTRVACDRAAAAAGVTLVAVQHHHAHLASCMVDRGLSGEVIGVCFDGAGLGDDGTLWGGEFLVGGYARARRMAHLACVGMPGGDAASREPWRMAVAHLRAAGLDPTRGPVAARVGEERVAAMVRLLDAGVRCPSTSSIGRLFDAVASLVGACDRSSFEGQAAMSLEGFARATPDGGAYPFEMRQDASGWIVDPAPLVREVAADVGRGLAPATVARRFHEGLSSMIVDVCSRVREREGLRDVVLTGGVFVNSLLSVLVSEQLTAAGFRAHRHREVPPNDGGLCLGQLAVAAALDAAGKG
jgi:hydrogenase maturation protein HypF